jgi:hypothetical protein
MGATKPNPLDTLEGRQRTFAVVLWRQMRELEDLPKKIEKTREMLRGFGIDPDKALEMVSASRIPEEE